MKLMRLAASLCIGAMIIMLFGCNNDINLDLNIKNGDKYLFRAMIERNIILDIENREIQTREKSDTTFNLKVLNVDKDKSSTIEYEYNSIHIAIESGEKIIEYDTKNSDKSSPLLVLYKSIVGKGFTVKLDNKGQVIEIKGVDDMLNSVLEKFPGTEEEKKSVMKSLSENFGEEAVKSMIIQSLGYFPQKEIKNNVNWETKYDMKMALPTTVINKLTLIDSDNKGLKVDNAGTVNIDTKETPIDFMGVKANLNLTGEIKGTLSIDKLSGLLKDENVTQNLQGSIEVIAGGSITQSIKAPVKIEANSSYTMMKR
ncbi:MAG: DUF6263 family protein [Bacillota bacterium]|nr:DUF6263 family protein [Bacillota bacterium]